MHRLLRIPLGFLTDEEIGKVMEAFCNPSLDALRRVTLADEEYKNSATSISVLIKSSTDDF